MDFYAQKAYTYKIENCIENIKRGNIQIIYNEEGDWEEVDTK